ncbi:MAG: hypothetical protein HOL36_03735, partial [Candidatus Marinimicrobia bacterium]|nr:hypothetical protein [Candidatus Neomarinimicrobiota bacterium]MBT5465444.1 hypothetical protein [Candidatus Neomarinimicrobiota bacterium]MBT7828877.1 hypothetical protein [Candidatus Neomarinimicrobiota bacterium]
MVSSGATAANLKNDVCIQCHTAAAVNALIHPLNNVNTESDQISVPEGFKLDSNGSLGCLTCHQVA